jgi:hypothetical protein
VHIILLKELQNTRWRSGHLSPTGAGINWKISSWY